MAFKEGKHESLTQEEAEEWLVGKYNPMPTLITLISGQLAPNLYSVLHLKPEKVILVHTKDTRGEAEHFKELVLKRYGVQSAELYECSPYDPEKLQNQATYLCEKLNGENNLILNYTGGTKPMSIHFYQVFKNRGAGLIYVDTQQETFWWTRNGHNEKEDVNIQLDLPALFLLKQASLRANTDKNQILALKNLTDFFFLCWWYPA